MPSIPWKDKAKQVEDWLLNSSLPRDPSIAQLRRYLRIAYAVGRDIARGNLTLYAMSLVFTTLLAIVPMLALSFSLLKALGVHNQLLPLIEQFLEPLGEQGAEIAESIVGFVDNIQVGVLGSLGLLLLVYAVISLIQKIEMSFNAVWRAPEMRSLSRRFSNYLSVIMIGPLLMFAAMGLSGSFLASDRVQSLMEIEPFGLLITMLTFLLPFFLVVAAFTFVYVFVPNTRVQFRSALFGGLIAGATWQATSIAFASFAMGSTKYEAIYSSFAIGIMLLIWLNINWLILLVGSTISYYHQHERSISSRPEARSSPELEEAVAMSLMLQLARAFDRGETPPRQDHLEESMGIPKDITRRVSDKLLRAGMLQLGGTTGDELLPGRSLDQISWRDVLKAARQDEDGLLLRIPSMNVPGISDIDDERLMRTLEEDIRSTKGVGKSE